MLQTKYTYRIGKILTNYASTKELIYYLRNINNSKKIKERQTSSKTIPPSAKKRHINRQQLYGKGRERQVKID